MAATMVSLKITQGSTIPIQSPVIKKMELYVLIILSTMSSEICCITSSLKCKDKNEKERLIFDSGDVYMENAVPNTPAMFLLFTNTPNHGECDTSVA